MSRVLIIIILLGLFTSCEKECTGDCAEISIRGQIINISNNQGIAKVPIQVYWQSSGFGFFNTKLKVANTKTNKHGQFKISKTIDRAKFDSYHLKVEADMPKGFIDNYAQNEKITEFFSQYERVNNINIALYPETKLLIKLVNSQNDTFNSFDLYYSYHKPFSVGVFNSTNGVVNDTTFNVKTAPNVYTIIKWSKSYGFGQTPTFVDSVLCSPSKENVFILNY